MRETGALYLCFALVVAGLGGTLVGCYQTTCTEAAKAWCDTCEKESDFDKDYCTCVQDSGLATSAAQQPFASDEDAGLWCDDVLNELKYVGDDAAQECKSEKDLINKWGTDYCDGFYGGYY